MFVLELVPRHEPAKELAKLREVEVLTDPEGSMKGNEMFSETRSGSDRAPGGARYAYDDHRESHRDEVERRFAKRIAESIAELARSRSAERLVLSADPRLLGLLRKSMNGTLPNGTELIELPEDLSGQSPERIQATLVRRGALRNGA
jgi:protein required for attachment to host cells